MKSDKVAVESGLRSPVALCSESRFGSTKLGGSWVYSSSCFYWLLCFKPFFFFDHFTIQRFRRLVSVLYLCFAVFVCYRFLFGCSLLCLLLVEKLNWASFFWGMRCELVFLRGWEPFFPVSLSRAPSPLYPLTASLCLFLVSSLLDVTHKKH